MSPLSQKRTTSSLAPPIFYVVKKSEERRLPIAGHSCKHWRTKNDLNIPNEFKIVIPDCKTKNCFKNTNMSLNE